jgi:hypothetical protein
MFDGKKPKPKNLVTSSPEQKEGTYACLPEANVLDEKGQTNSHTLNPGLRIDLNTGKKIYI